jgi:hypothetical protein
VVLAVLVLAAALVVAVGGVALFLTLRGRGTSSVDSFRRHIDALGPEARRTTVDQVQIHTEREPDDGDAEVRDGDGADGR